MSTGRTPLRRTSASGRRRGGSDPQAEKMRDGGVASVPHFAGTGAQESVVHEKALCYDKENFPLAYDAPSTAALFSGRETFSRRKVEKGARTA